MVEAPKYVIYSNTPPHTRAHWVRSVDAHRRWVFRFKWEVVEIRTRDLLSRWLLIPCQGTNSAKSLSWWLRPHDILYILTFLGSEWSNFKFIDTAKAQTINLKLKQILPICQIPSPSTNPSSIAHLYSYITMLINLATNKSYSRNGILHKTKPLEVTFWNKHILHQLATERTHLYHHVVPKK